MENLGKNISEIFDANNKYIIPLYQRNYSWRKEQIEALIQDVYEACEQNPKGNYYIGSLVVLRRHNGDYEVIDGQQRLTTLSLLTKILGVTNFPILYYESRPEVEEFFEEFYKSQDGTCMTQKPQTFYLREAIDSIKLAEFIDKEEKRISFEEWSSKIKNYLANNVILVKVEIPEDTDVASYFEIMNNRGEQLQKHEILKARLMNVLERQYHAEFNLIWTACSNMDVPIQQCFNADDRKKYFGNEYQDFTFKKFNDSSSVDNSDNPCSINEIIKSNIIVASGNEDKNKDDNSTLNSIIDFPNFLMHVLKLFAKPKDKTVDVRLNEKYMLDCATDVFGKEPQETDVKEFIKLLFRVRTLFDRYVVKTKNGETEDEFSWELKRPQKYPNDNKNYVRYDLLTFGETKLQKRMIKAQSMLQVTFRQRIYKNWLLEILGFLNDQQCEISEIDGEKVLECLHKYMVSQYDNLRISFNEMYKEGVRTPHFLLNFIDYLYWFEDFKAEKSKLENFEFRYWNSVEHHLARNYAKETGECDENIVDCLGNLFLISKNTNSRLNDRSVGEKIGRYKESNLGANRQIIYSKGSNWNEEAIKNHYNELVELLNNQQNILGMS